MNISVFNGELWDLVGSTQKRNSANKYEEKHTFSIKLLTALC